MKQNIQYYLYIYKKILIQDLKSKMSYRMDFVISLIGILFVNISGYISFWIIFQNFNTIMGWSYYEMLFLYGFSLIALTPMQCFFDNNWNLQSYVYSGDFIKFCFKPINIYFYFISESFDIKGLGQLVFGICSLGIAWNKLQLDFSLLILSNLIVQLVSASLFMIAISNFSAATAFFNKGGTGYIMVLATRFKDYARYPVTIFQGVFRFVFTFFIPIAFMAYYPAMFFLKDRNPSFLSYITPLYGCIFFYLSYKFWMKGVEKCANTGT